MRDDGIELKSPEGMTFVFSGLALLLLFIMLNKGMRREGSSGTQGALGVRG